MTLSDAARTIKLQFVAQIAMIVTPVILSFAATILTGYINKIEGRISTLEATANVLDRRVTVVEQAIIERERFEGMTTNKLDRLQDSIIILGNNVAGVAATLAERRPIP